MNYTIILCWLYILPRGWHIFTCRLYIFLPWIIHFHHLDYTFILCWLYILPRGWHIFTYGLFILSFGLYIYPMLIIHFSRGLHIFHLRIKRYVKWIFNLFQVDYTFLNFSYKSEIPYPTPCSNGLYFYSINFVVYLQVCSSTHFY